MKVRIDSARVRGDRPNGCCYCSLYDETGNILISADLEYVMAAIKERGYELTNSLEVLHVVSKFNMTARRS